MIQCISCPCGKVFAACREPECYEDAEWQKDMRKHVKKGCSVKMVDNGVGKLFDKCTCPNMNPKQPKQTELFS